MKVRIKGGKKRPQLKTPPKQKRTRGELESCFKCPSAHPGWKRYELRSRRRIRLCPEHVEAFDEKHKPWPSCPKCGGDEFGIMRWGGSAESTTAHCEDCGFKDRAVKYFDTVTIKITASPIQHSRNALDPT